LSDNAHYRQHKQHRILIIYNNINTIITIAPL
jgi:hypothetical protein